MKKAFDKKGKEIKSYSSVLVPKPSRSDIHIHKFQGTVADILDNGNVIVEDKESNFFEIEANRLEVVED